MELDSRTGLEGSHCESYQCKPPREEGSGWKRTLTLDDRYFLAKLKLSASIRAVRTTNTYEFGSKFCTLVSVAVNRQAFARCCTHERERREKESKSKRTSISTWLTRQTFGNHTNTGDVSLPKNNKNNRVNIHDNQWIYTHHCQALSNHWKLYAALAIWPSCHGCN